MLFFIGCIAVLAFVLNWVSLCYAWFYPKRKLSDLGPWTVITGCTDGIGRAYALHLARSNATHLLLVARSAEKLEDLQAEIRKTNFTKTLEVHQFDFLNPKDQAWSQLEALISKKEVGFLINNVGVSYPSAMYYHEVPNALLNELIDVNVISVFRMTQMVVKGMCDRSKGVILCIGSGAGELGTPLLAGYAASKAAVSAFCRSLQAECREHNVVVQCQTPLFVTSKMSKVKRPSITIPSPETYVKWSVKMILGATLIGFLETPIVVSPYPVHAVMLDMLKRVPSMFAERYQMSSQVALHRKAMSKKAI